MPHNWPLHNPPTFLGYCAGWSIGTLVSAGGFNCWYQVMVKAGFDDVPMRLLGKAAVLEGCEIDHVSQSVQERMTHSRGSLQDLNGNSGDCAKEWFLPVHRIPPRFTTTGSLWTLCRQWPFPALIRPRKLSNSQGRPVHQLADPWHAGHRNGRLPRGGPL